MTFKTYTDEFKRGVLAAEGSRTITQLERDLDDMTRLKRNLGVNQLSQ